MDLEEYRYNDFNVNALALSTKPPIKLYVNYNEHVNYAYKFTINSLRELEHSKESIGHHYCIQAFSMWYLSCSSFINTLVKLLSIRVGFDYFGVSRLSLDMRYNLLLEKFKIKAEFDEFTEKLKDFEILNNNLSASLLEDEKLIFKHAVFTTNPLFFNQIDAFQALLISNELFEKLRFIISGLDIMPNVSLMTPANIIVFEKLNLLKETVLCPSLKDILSKHKLTTKLDFFKKPNSYIASPLFEPKQVLMIRKYKEEDRFKIDLKEKTTDIVSKFHENLMKKYEGKEMSFGDNYMAKK